MDMKERTEWLHRATAAPEEVLMFELGLAYWALKAASERYVGLPWARLRLLSLVYRAGEVSQAELQRRLDIDGAAITRHVKQLEAEGLITRRPDPADNRLTLVALTSRGTDKLVEAGKKGRALVSHCVAGIDPADVDIARRVLAHVRENVNGLAEASENSGKGEQTSS
jgi:DNA-binding MarR family transcriptional regulator